MPIRTSSDKGLSTTSRSTISPLLSSFIQPDFRAQVKPTPDKINSFLISVFCDCVVVLVSVKPAFSKTLCNSFPYSVDLIGPMNGCLVSD